MDEGALIKGGRLRKTARGIISFAPFLSGASALALGALMATSSPVQAGTCTQAGTTGMWTCTGAAESDGSQTITGNANQNIHVTGEAGFGLNVSGAGDAIDVNSVATTGAIDVNLTNNNNITSQFNSINIHQMGTGTITLATNGTLTSTGSYSAVVINQRNIGGIDLTMDGAVTGGSYGISMATVAETTGEVNVTVKDVTGVSEAISIDHKGNSAVTFTSTGTVTSNTGYAIRVNHSGTGDVHITTGGTVTARQADQHAIRVSQSGSGSVFITVNGRIVGGSSASAISISTGSASDNATITLGTDADLEGNVDTSGVMGTTGIVLTGAGDADFNLDDDLDKFTDFNTLEKTGSGTWRLTNREGDVKTFDRIDVTEGKLVSTTLTELVGTNLNIAEGAIFEVEQEGTALINTAVTLSGTIELSGADTTLSVHNNPLTNNGGNVVIPVDFSAGFEDGEHSSLVTRFSAQSVDGEAIVINIRAVGELPGETEEPVRLGNLVAVETANPNAFTAGEVLGGRMSFGFEVTDQGEWIALVTKVATGGIEEALYESLPAALTQFASLESYQQRLQGRQHGENGGVWAKVSSVSAEFEPVASTLATHKIEDAVAEFGIDAPLAIAHPSIPGNFAVGATAALGDATTDVAVSDRAGNIETTSLKAAISVHWEYEGAYVDGQLQYATFDNDIGTEEMKLGSTNATAYSGGLEVGYGGAVGDLLVIPSAQLLWTSVDFEDFTDSEDMEIVLDDGVVVTGRAGVGLEYGWKGALYGDVPSGYVFLRGHADVLLPVDGDVNTRINETEFVSKREDPVFDAGIGATYTWYDAYALSVDVSTQQGEEVEGYAGSVGFKYKF